jgi:cytochrome c-type biogenesis protein CcsB
MSKIEGLLLWPAMFGYLAVFIMYLMVIVFKKDRLESRAWKIFVLSFLLQTASVAWRWYISGRIPVMVSYEHYQLGSWCVGLVTVIGGLFYRQMRITAIGSTIIILLMLGIGMNTYSEMDPLRPPYRSNWIFIHIGFAWFAWGCFVVATVLAFAYLFKRPGKEEGRFMRRFPSREIMDELMLKMILFGFICQGFMIGAGAIWAHQLWGRYWGWDPVETWSLVCWLVYGLVLHFRLMMGWRGVKMAVMVILALTTAIVYFWGVGFMPQSHTSLMMMEFE